MDQRTVIHCIGDSHASFFSGYNVVQPTYPEISVNKYPFIKSYRLGAVLAYSLATSGTREEGREKLYDLVNGLDRSSQLIFCFGEIDCRCHLIYQSELQGKSLNEVVENCIKKYFKVVDELMALGFNIAIWGAIATGSSDNVEYPMYGTEVQRNACTILFNKFAERECLARGIGFVSINKFLVRRNLTTKKNFYFDGVHLGKIALPIAFRELKRNKYTACIMPFSNWRIGLQVAYAKLEYALKCLIRYPNI